MTRYLVVRVIGVIPTLIGISILVFGITYLIPGDPALIMAGSEATPEVVANLRQQWGLDQPVYMRYLSWLGNIARGNLGDSYFSRQSVVQLVGNALPVTLELAVLSMLVAVLIAIPTGIVSAVKAGSWFDLGAAALGFIGLSIPSFWLGIMLIYLFAVHFQVLPAGGFTPLSSGLVPNLKSMILPSFALGTFASTQLMRYLRASLLDVLHADYIRTARAKGMRERSVLVAHAVRNALIPFITVLGVQMGYLLGGTVIAESVFALPGIGRLVLTAVLNRDYQVATGIIFLIAASFVLINLVVDMLYPVLDPRVRLARSRA
ncbi:MAG TPA: ABC transporter permease [Chloroflexota bacterium]|nr:ABC transporter permease [Chloroflexota bacterium]